MGNFRVLHVGDAAVGLEVDVVQTSQEGLLEDVLYARVVQHHQQVVHGQYRLAQRLDEHVFPLVARGIKEDRSQSIMDMVSVRKTMRHPVGGD